MAPCHAHVGTSWITGMHVGDRAKSQTPAVARSSLRNTGTLTITVLSAALSAIAMAANGKASGSPLIEAVPACNGWQR